MIWVAWKQHRAGVFTALAVLAGLAVAQLVARLGVESALSGLGEAGCLSKSACSFDAASRAFSEHGLILNLMPAVLYALPVVLGILGGAPLYARELSQGSHVFSLTQSVSRLRWWAAKLGVSLLPIAVGLGLFGLYSWWVYGPLTDLNSSPLSPGNFETVGPVMAGYLVFAFALSATLGLVIRNNVVPMVITVAVVVVVALTMVLFVRPAFAPTESVVMDLDSAGTTGPPENAWQVGHLYVAPDGKRTSDFNEVCPVSVECDDTRIADLIALYHPASRFWLFQGMETGVYLLLGAAALAVGARRLRALP